MTGKTRRFTEVSGKTMRHALWLAAGATGLALSAGAASARAQETSVTGSAVTLSVRAATLELEMSDGTTRVIALRDGEIFVDGSARGTYERGGAVERSWRDLLRSPDVLDGGDASAALSAWKPPRAEEPAAAELLSRTIADLAAARQTSALTDVGQPAAGPDGRQVMIAPGVIPLEDLQASFDRLRRSMTHLRGEVRDLDDSFALVVHDDHAIPADQVVPGNLALLGGELALAGTVAGDVLVLDGRLVLEPTARIEGDLLQVGGDVHEAGGKVEGEMVSLLAGDLERRIREEIEAEIAGTADLEPGATPGAEIQIHPSNWLGRSVGHVGHNIGRAIGGVMAVLAWFLGLGALGVVVVYFFRRRLEIAADTVRANVVRSFGVGLAGQLLVIPVLLVLVVGIVTWLAIPFFILAVVLAIPAGYLAVGHAAGETIALQRYDWMERFRFRRNNSYYYVLSGLFFLLAPFAVGALLHLFGGFLGFLRGLSFFAGGLLTWFALTTGFGAVILTRGGSRALHARSVTDHDLFASGDGFGEEGTASA